MRPSYGGSSPLPQNVPRVDEIALIICQSRDAGLSIQQTAAKIAALQPKSVDPRIAVILGILDSSASTSDVKAKEITATLDALDGAK